MSIADENIVDRGANNCTLLAHTFSNAKQYGVVYKRDQLVNWPAYPFGLIELQV